MSENLGSKEIRLGSQVRKQEWANILKWGFSFGVSPIPTWIQNDSTVPWDLFAIFLNVKVF